MGKYNKNSIEEPNMNIIIIVLKWHDIDDEGVGIFFINNNNKKNSYQWDVHSH